MRSRVTEWHWHRWRGLSVDRADLFRGRLTLGWLTVFVWWFDGSLRQRLADIEAKLRQAMNTRSNDDFSAR